MISFEQGNAAIDVDSSWVEIENFLGAPSPPLLVGYSARSHPVSSGPIVRKFYGYPGGVRFSRLMY